MLIFQLNVYLCDFLHYTCSLTLILNMNRLIEVLIKIMLLFSLLVSLFLHCVVCVSKNSIGTYFPTPLTTQIHIPVDYSPTPLTTQIHIPVGFTYTSFHTNTHTSWVYLHLLPHKYTYQWSLPTPLTTQIHIPVEFTYTSFHTNTHTS